MSEFRLGQGCVVPDHRNGAAKRLAGSAQGAMVGRTCSKATCFSVADWADEGAQEAIIEAFKKKFNEPWMTQGFDHRLWRTMWILKEAVERRRRPPTRSR